MSSLIYWLGIAIHARIAAESEWRREHGRSIPVWVATCYLAAGILTLILVDRETAPLAVEANAACGIVVGLTVGLVHGTVKMCFKDVSENVPKEASDSMSASPPDQNPYEPPRVE